MVEEEPMLLARTTSRPLPLALLFFLAAAAACGASPTAPPGGAVVLPPKSTGTAVAPPSPAAGGEGIDTAGMDTAVAPGQDFFAYANGGWIKATPIPPDRS